MDKAVFRNLYRAAVKPENLECFKAKASSAAPEVKKLIAEGKLLGLSVFNWKQHVFVYYETVDCKICPCKLLGGADECLESWPGADEARKWIPLIDIFHFNAPASLEHWQRKAPVEAHMGKIGMLKPEMIQFYMFYHYGLQNERPFSGDKYQIIGINENVIFCYGEAPSVVEQPVLPPQVESHVVPEDWGGLAVGPKSFIPWEDRIGTGEERLRAMDEVISVW